MIQLPDSTLDTRLADRVLELMQTELGHELTGGVLPLDDQRGLEQTGLSTPTLRVLIRAPQDEYDTYQHETQLLLLLVTRRTSSEHTDRWRTHRLLWAIKYVLRREVGQLVTEHEASYQYELVELDERIAYFFEPTRTLLATPVFVTVKTHQLDLTMEIDQP